MAVNEDQVSPLEEGIPLWRRIERALLDDIAAGRIVAGEKIHNEIELADRFSAHRHTVRRAIASLVQKGALRIERGRGTFVHHDPIDYVIGRRTRFEENLLRQNRNHRGKMLWFAETSAAPAVAAALAIREGTKVIVADTINSDNDIPISLARLFLPAKRFHGFPEAYEEAKGSVTAALNKCGVPDFVRHFTRISTRLPTVDDAKLLRQPTSLPILQIESVEADLKGVPVKYATARYAGERVNLVLTTQDEGPGTKRVR